MHYFLSYKELACIHLCFVVHYRLLKISSFYLSQAAKYCVFLLHYHYYHTRKKRIGKEGGGLLQDKYIWCDAVLSPLHLFCWCTRSNKSITGSCMTRRSRKVEKNILMISSFAMVLYLYALFMCQWWWCWRVRNLVLLLIGCIREKRRNMMGGNFFWEVIQTIKYHHFIHVFVVRRVMLKKRKMVSLFRIPLDCMVQLIGYCLKQYYMKKVKRNKNIILDNTNIFLSAEEYQFQWLLLWIDCI